MIGRLIVALLMIGAAAIVTMERETAVVADMTADLAESKYSDSEERARKYEARAKEAEAKAAELETRNQFLEAEIVTAREQRELALLPLEMSMREPSTKGSLPVSDLIEVARAHESATRACFARAPTRGPKVKMSFVIGTDGRVSSVTNTDVIADYAGVVACLQSELSGWRFKPAKDGVTLASLAFITERPAGNDPTPL